MLESKIQSRLIKKLQGQGYYVIKLMKTNINGIPDLLALKDGETPRFIEVKGPRTRVSELQEYRIKQLKELGFKAEIYRVET